MTQTALDKARQVRAEMAAAGIKVHVKTPLERLADNPLSLRAAVNAKCYQCEGEDADPGVKKRIGSCTIRECGLWAVRPYQRSVDGDEVLDAGSVL